MTSYLIIPKDPLSMNKLKIEQIIAAHGNMTIENCSDNVVVVDTDADTIKAFKKAHKGWMVGLNKDVISAPDPDPMKPK